jgi:hypothetical protein
MDTRPSEVCATIDWLSMTTGPGDDAEQAWDTATALASEQNKIGNETRPWQANGYVGWGTRHLRFGRKGDDCAIELSGDLADRYWEHFALLSTSISRLDPAVTVRFDRPVGDLAVRGYDAARVRVAGGHDPITKTLMKNTGGGQTLYLGAMGGRRMARLYDKHIESRGEYPENTWRYEVQARSPHSSDLASDIRRSHHVPGAISAHVHRFFDKHGVSPWFLPDGTFVPGIRRKPRTDLSGRFDWWAAQVAPGVRRSLAAAPRGAIADALGLNEGYLG